MTLRLSVVSEHAIRLGPQSTKVFGVHGGTIGRATDNAWILPDPERYLSGKHVRIDFRAGSYVLVDTSSNGTYVNGAQVPLGKYHDYVLKDGDCVRLGEYELLVSIDKGTDFPTEQGAIVAYDGEAKSSAVKKSTANDLGADLDLSQLLEPSDQMAVESGVRNAYGQSVVPDDEAQDPREKTGTPWHMMTRPVRVEPIPAAVTRSAGPALYEGDYDLGLAAFCRGAGIDPRNITSEARGAA
jgi:type VI secretion system FHA domain protein